mgnify:CR=1 FL=1
MNQHTYVAPVSGYYNFVVQVWPIHGDVHTVFSIMVNGLVKGVGGQNGDDDDGGADGGASATFIIKVKKGASVAVKNVQSKDKFHGYNVENEYHSFFMGYLMYELD